MRSDTETSRQLPLYVEPEPEEGPRLAHFPITFFAVVMGLAGTSLAWTRAAAVLDVPTAVGTTVFWVALATFLLVTTAYVGKAVVATRAVREELRHPIRMAFVPTATISLLLLAAAGRETAHGLATGLWWVGVVGQLVLTLYVLTAWVNRSDFGMHHVTPAWFIPVVGTLVVPLAGADLGPLELSWFFYAIGLLFWAALLPLVVTRLFVHEQEVPARLLPTLAILAAPPAVAMVAYLRLVPDGFGTFTRVLAYGALFFLLLFLAQAGRLRRLPFFLSWWAYGFPLAAVTVSTLVTAESLGAPGWARALAWLLLVATSGLVLLLAVRTATAMIRGQVCVPE